MKLKVITNLILLISNVSFSVSKVRNYHARIVKKKKKNHHTQSVSTDNCRFGSSGLLPVKVKKKKCDKNLMFYLYPSGWPTYTFQVKHSFWFYKKKNKLSGVRRLELDMCMLAHFRFWSLRGWAGFTESIKKGKFVTKIFSFQIMLNEILKK